MEDWNIVDQLRPPFVSPPMNPSSFLCNYNYVHYPDLQMMKDPVMVMQESQAVVGGIMEKKSSNGNGNEELEEKNKKRKKKRLTSEQLESLESGFKEDIKLEPERKMELAREVGLQPRQVAIWFQNRRARWKAKKLEDLYHALKHQFNLVSRDKQKLQQEVLELKALLKDQTAKNQVFSRGYTGITGEEEAVESTSVGNRSSSKPAVAGTTPSSHHHRYHQQQFNVDRDEEFNIPVMASPYWGTVLPSYP